MISFGLSLPFSFIVIWRSNFNRKEVQLSIVWFFFRFLVQKRPHNGVGTPKRSDDLGSHSSTVWDLHVDDISRRWCRNEIFEGICKHGASSSCVAGFYSGAPNKAATIIGERCIRAFGRIIVAPFIRQIQQPRHWAIFELFHSLMVGNFNCPPEYLIALAQSYVVQ